MVAVVVGRTPWLLARWLAGWLVGWLQLAGWLGWTGWLGTRSSGRHSARMRGQRARLATATTAQT